MRRFISLLAVLVLACTVMAQEGEPRPDGERGGRWNREGREGRRERMLERLAAELELDEAQAQQVREIMEAHRGQGGRPPWQELREAREAGDEARVAELQAQMESFREQRQAQMQAVQEEIETVLNDDQLDRFDEMRARMEQRREMFRVARELPDELEMNDEQRDQYRQMMRQRWEDMRSRMESAIAEEADGGTPAELPDLAASQEEFFQQVEQILDKDQVKALGEYRARLRAETTTETPLDNVRLVLGAARRVRPLTSEQRVRLRELHESARQASRSLRKSDKDGQVELTARIQKEVEAMFDAGQLEQFNKNIERLQKRGSGARRARDHRTPARGDR